MFQPEDIAAFRIIRRIIYGSIVASLCVAVCIVKYAIDIHIGFIWLFEVLTTEPIGTPKP